jgi:nucleoside 2-deoxyribosyltransferase
MKNYLKNKTVYLAGPIHAVADDGIGWRKYISPILKKRFKIKVDDPTKKTINGKGEVKEDKKDLINLIKQKKFSQVKENFWWIVRKDLRSVDKADFLIVVYDPTVHSVGTIHEVIEAHRQRKPVLIWYDESKVEKFNPWILTFTKENMIFTEWEDLFAYLQEVDNGKFDTSYWTLGD